MRYVFQEHYLIHPLIMRVEIALKFIYQILLVLVYNVSDFRLFYVFL